MSGFNCHGNGTSRVKISRNLRELHAPAKPVLYKTLIKRVKMTLAYLMHSRKAPMKTICKQTLRAVYQSTGATLCTGAILLLAATISAQAQYHYTTLSAPGAGWTYAHGISGNNIVGDYYKGMDESFLYNGSSYSTLNVASGDFASVWGVDGNNVVGYYNDGSYHGFLYDGSNFTPLNAPGAGVTFAYGISGNNIVGYSGLQSFLYNTSSQTYSSVNVPGSTQTYAFGISGNNVVGYYNGGLHPQGFLYNISSQIYTTLNMPGESGTEAIGISGNNIVGQFYNGSVWQAFLYNGSTYTALNVPGATTSEATGIYGNKIVGTYAVGNSSSQSFLATPVPEPSTLGLLAVGVAVLGGLIRKETRARV